MRLLILTQKVNKEDPILGFFHRWIEEFAVHCASVTVFCLEEGQHALPSNVHVYSLGKERGASRRIYMWRLYSYVWKYRKNYDHVFVHMNPEYVVLCGLLWRMLRKKIILWYTHKSVTWTLRIAEKITNTICSATQKSFRLPTSKLRIMGHGIDTALFRPGVASQRHDILMVGRISNTKGQLRLLDAFHPLMSTYPDVNIRIIGEPVTGEEEEYEQRLKRYIARHQLSGRVTRIGRITNTDMPTQLHSARLLVNLSQTGSLDKDVLEAMACNVPVCTTNEAFADMLEPPYYTTTMDSVVLTAALEHQTVPTYRLDIERYHTVQSLIQRIMVTYEAAS